MSWIQKNTEVEVSKELEFNNNRVTETNAYSAIITEAYLKDSSDKTSKSQSLVIGVKTEDGDTATTYFTIKGRDGNTYFKSTVAGKEVLKQHFGLNIVSSLFKIALNKEIFDCEPSETTCQQWNKETKEMETLEVMGFPELIDKPVGICVQMIRKIDGKNSSEYPEISYFFDKETGLFADEKSGEKRTKLDRWLASAKDFKVVEEKAPKSSFGKKDTTADKPKRKWGSN